MTYNDKIRLVRNGGGTLRLSLHEPQERVYVLSRANLLHHHRSAYINDDDDTLFRHIAASGLFSVNQLSRICHTPHHRIKDLVVDVDGMPPQRAGGRLNPDSLEYLVYAAKAQYYEGSYDEDMVVRAIDAGTSITVVASILGIHPSAVKAMQGRVHKREKEEERGGYDRDHRIPGPDKSRVDDFEGGRKSSEFETRVHDEPERPVGAADSEPDFGGPAGDGCTGTVLYVTDDDLLLEGGGDETELAEHVEAGFDDLRANSDGSGFGTDVHSVDTGGESSSSADVDSEDTSWIDDLFGHRDTG